MAYQGYTATFVAGRGGLNGSENVELIPPTDLLDAHNIRYDGNAWRKAGGMIPFDDNVVSTLIDGGETPICLSGYDFHITTSVQRQITAWTDYTTGAVFKEISGDMDAETLVDGLNFTHPVVFVECGQESAGNNKKLLMFSRGVTPHYLDGDGSTMTALDSDHLSLDWSGTNMPAAGLLHDNRVIAWGNPNAPHTIYASTISDHTNFKYEDATSQFPTPTFDVAGGEGEYIAACTSIGTTRLYIFKYPTGIYFVDTDKITSYFIPTTTVRRDIGVAGPHAITRVGSMGTWFIGSDGHVYSLESVSNPDVDLKDASITGQMNMNKWIMDNVNPSLLGQARLVYDPQRREVWAVYATSSSLSNDICLVFDVQNPQQPRIAVEDRGKYFNALWTYKDAGRTFPVVLAGGEDGYVYKMNQNSRVIGTDTGYGAFLRTPDTDFSFLSEDLANRSKRFDYLEVVMQSTGRHQLYISTFVDGEYYSTYAVTCGEDQATLYDGIAPTGYGLTPVTTKTPFRFATTGLIRRKVHIGGLGRRFGFKIYNNNADEDFNVAKVIVSFNVLGTGGEAEQAVAAQS